MTLPYYALLVVFLNSSGDPASSVVFPTLHPSQEWCEVAAEAVRQKAVLPLQTLCIPQSPPQYQ